MADEIERPQKYQALNDYVDALLEGRKPRVSAHLRGQTAELLRTAALFNSVAAREVVPTQPFVQSVAAKLKPRSRRLRNWRPSVSRRGFLGGLAGGVALFLAGAFGDRLGLRLGSSPMAKGWVRVAAVADLPPGAVKRFAANDIVGHIMNVGGKLWALSAICTHQACLLKWRPGDQLFDCPCHGAAFNADGTQHPIPSYNRVLAPLPRMPVQVMNGEVYVQVPSSSNDTTPPGDY